MTAGTSMNSFHQFVTLVTVRKGARFSGSNVNVYCSEVPVLLVARHLAPQRSALIYGPLRASYF